MKLTQFKHRNPFLSLFLAILITTQSFIPALALEPLPSEASLLEEETYAYTEITDATDLTSGDTYAIVYSSVDTGGSILYHKDTATLTDQVTGLINSGILTLNDITKFPEETQTWMLTATDGGFTVKSRSGTDKYLNMNVVTAVGSKVPVGAQAQVMTIAAATKGFTVSRQVGSDVLYLARSASTGQYFVSSAPCSLRLFKKTLVTPVEPEPPVDPLVIPGYTRVESADLDPSKVYMIVCKDSADQIYAFYPDAAHADADPGNAINPSHVNHKSGCPAGCFVAKLTVKNNAVTAQRATVDAEFIDMNDLHLTVRAANDKWALKFTNNLYLELASTILTTSTTSLSVNMDANGVFTLSSAKRTLSLNIKGDKTQFKSFETNFWGPSATQLPIYLYSKDGASVTPELPIVDKTTLQAAITKAESLQSSAIYTQESRDLLIPLLANAKTELDNTSSTLDSVQHIQTLLTQAIDALVPVNLAPDKPAAATGITEDQPFINDVTGGSHTFRIPALTKLNDGSLAAAIDARWDKCPDGYGIDTLFSRSTDDGKTWTYNFPNYFNDSVDAYYANATAFLDPLMIQGKDGTIYLMADVFPGGHYIFSVDKASGFESIEGETEKRMVLYTAASGQTSTNYNYYIGAFTGQFAPVIAKDDSTKTAAYYVDGNYYLYTADEKPMYCQQIGSTQYVKQNVFYKNAALHVRNATYLWLVTSTDNGQTWSTPTIMNGMVRPNATHQFYGVGPGAGLCLDDGTILLPCYESGKGQQEHASFIYNKNGDKTVWYRSPNATQDRSSESVLVQLSENSVRQIYRNDHNVVCYTDFTRDENGDWTPGSLVEIPNAPKTLNNQVSAIRYSQKVNGQNLILVSTAATGDKSRNNGKIYAFALGEDAEQTMTLINTYEVTKPGIYYGYSSITEQRDGSIGLLYETGKSSDYLSIPIENIIQGISINGKQNISIQLYDTVENQDVVPTAEDLKQLNSTIVRAELKEGKVYYTGLQAGETQMTTASGITVTIQITGSTNIQTHTLNIEETIQFPVKTDRLYNTAPAVVNAAISTVDNSFDVNGGQGRIGTDNTYTGALNPLSNALFRFNGDSQNGFQIAGQTDEGQTFWVSVRSIGIPTSSTADTVTLTENNDDTFYLHPTNGYLYFHRSGTKVGAFDRNSLIHDSCKFMLFRPAVAGDTESVNLPGYVQITHLEDIHDGSFYLIAAAIEQDIYVLRPSSSSNGYGHALKVDLSAENIQTHVDNKHQVLTITGKSAGVANVAVDDQTYKVTVLPAYVPPVNPSQPNTGNNNPSSDSTTTTTVTQPDGTVIKTTLNRDGSSSIVETRLNGVVVEYATTATGKTTASVTTPPGINSATVTIPVATPTTGHVAVVIHPDGSREIVKTSTIVQNGVYLTATSGGKYEIIDNTKTFEDVPENHWAKDSIGYVAAREIFNGTGATSFNPELSMTRGMLVKVLHNLENTPNATIATSFEDIDDNAWFGAAVQWATEHDIVTGYGNNLFGPADKLSREQLVVILYRYAGKPEVSKTDLQFADASDVSDYAKDAVIWATNNKIINGTGDNLLAPKEDTSRAQVAAMLMRFLMFQK